MTSYKSLAMLICDIEKYSEDHPFSEAESLIEEARDTLRKDLRNHVEQRCKSRNSGLSSGAQLHS